MPRKDQGWITFQTSDEERQLLEAICQQSQRSKTDVLREMLRGLQYAIPTPTDEPEPELQSQQRPKAQEQQADALPKKSLKVSSRNVFKGKINHIVKGSVNTEVTLEIMYPVELTSIITTTSAETLELAEGKTAYAVIKSNDVVIAME